ncbi:MAG TPA: trypsin-like peptidase domain-containing protein [archaeon]|nr:trypsin-like peptidase domain-containing protein [archaeon]
MSGKKNKIVLNMKRTRIVIIAIVIVLVSAGFLYYNNMISEKFSSLENDYNSKLGAAEQSFLAKQEQLKKDYTTQINYIDTQLKNTQSEYQKKISSLASAVSTLENKSASDINLLQQQIKDINIQSADFSAIVNDVLQGVVSISTDLGQGSGAIITSNGYIITNYHVIEDATIIRALTYDKGIYTATLIGSDINKDISVLKISGSFVALQFDDSSTVKIGEKVIALGNPAGLSFTVTEGIVSAFRTSGGIKYIQTDVPINPGNSGGPLVNKEGKIIGINNMKVRGFEGLGFAIESNTVKSAVNGILAANNLTAIV